MANPTPEELAEIAKGRTAKAELAITEQAFAEVRQAMLEVIATSKIGETELRERLFMGVQVLENVKRWLCKAAEGAEVAEYVAEMRTIVGAGEHVV